MKNFKKELTELLNRYSKESESDTPDYALAYFLRKCLYAYNETIKMRRQFWQDPWPSEVIDHKARTKSKKTTCTEK